jgi:carboxylesterase type B
MIRAYWAQFVRTGDPNFEGAPGWLPYNDSSAEYLELGGHIAAHPIAERIRTLEGIMKEVVQQ